jgi:hypothetical protein
MKWMARLTNVSGVMLAASLSCHAGRIRLCHTNIPTELLEITPRRKVAYCRFKGTKKATIVNTPGLFGPKLDPKSKALARYCKENGYSFITKVEKLLHGENQLFQLIFPNQVSTSKTSEIALALKVWQIPNFVIGLKMRNLFTVILLKVL